MKDEYSQEEIEEMIESHREKFINYWGLKDNEEKLVRDYTDSLKRLVNGEMEKNALKTVLDQMLEEDEEE